MLTTSLYNELGAVLPPGTPLYLGRRHLQENAAPPRLVLYPTGDSFGPPERKALEPGRVFWTREAGFELVLWGRDWDETEGMLNEALTALRRLASVSVQLRGGDWSDDTWLTLGVAYVLRFTVAAPVIETERFATLETIAQECGGFMQD